MPLMVERLIHEEKPYLKEALRELGGRRQAEAKRREQKQAQKAKRGKQK
jgi:hypothetical protein